MEGLDLKYVCEKNYVFDNKLFVVRDTNEVHQQIANDPDGQFCVAYFNKQDQNTEKKNMEPCTNFAWDKKSTKLLIQEYYKRKKDFRDPKIKKRSLWTSIKRKFLDEKYNVTEDILDRKWRNLKKHYTHVSDNKRSTGRGAIGWEHYEIFEEIYAEDRLMNLPSTISSFSVLDKENNALGNETAVHKGKYDMKKSHIDSSTPMEILSSSSAIIEPRKTTSEVLGKVNSNENIRDSPSPSTPRQLLSSPSTPKRSTRKSGAYYIRKEMLDIERKRLTELQLLRQAIEKNSEIQEKRNNLLERLLNKHVNLSE